MQINKLRRKLRVAAAATAVGTMVVVTGVNVFAGLNATVVASQSDTAGTLKLTSADKGAGFSTGISNLAPGDIVNRYVTLTNGGSLSAQSLGLAIATTGTATLITDGTGAATNKALTVKVTSCSGDWDNTAGTCSGTPTVEIAETTLSAFSTEKLFGTTSTLAANGTAKLQIQVKLPDQNETTVGGVLPTTTVQNGTANLTFTFSEAQRSATTTNS